MSQGPSSDVAFSQAVKREQEKRGSRSAYRRVELNGGFETVIGDDLRGFLEEVDTAFLATASADGQPYVQHRGGQHGFIIAIDDHTLGFADLAGNKQYVSTGNLAENDKVCLLLMDYAHKRRVKVWGRARMVPATPELLAKLPPREPRARVEQVFLLTVTAWDVNCPQHIPHKLDAGEVAEVIGSLKKRVAELEAQR